MSNILSKTQHCLVTLLAVGTLWAGLGLNEAFAGVDEKRYPATMCRPGDRYMQNFGVSSGMHIYNKSTTGWLIVYCPIIRDIMADYYPRLKWVKVNFKNPYHANRKVACMVQTRKPLGGTLVQRKYRDAVTASQSGAGTLYLSLPSQTLYTPGTYYMMTCYLPPNGGSQKIKLLDYQSREED